MAMSIRFEITYLRSIEPMSKLLLDTDLKSNKNLSIQKKQFALRIEDGNLKSYLPRLDKRSTGTLGLDNAGSEKVDFPHFMPGTT